MEAAPARERRVETVCAMASEWNCAGEKTVLSLKSFFEYTASLISLLFKKEK